MGWDVVNEVLEEERKQQGPPKQTKQQKKAQQKRTFKQQNSDLYGLPGMNMSGGMKFIYMCVILSVFFGLCALALRKLQQYNESATGGSKIVNEKKMAKKAAKEAVKL